MEITDCMVFPKKFMLRKPLVLKGNPIGLRNVLYFYVTDDREHRLITEASPLPFFSPETTKQAYEALNTLTLERLNSMVAFYFDDFMEHKHPMSPFPSVRFAVESALVRLYEMNGTFEPPMGEVTSNALITDIDEGAFRRFDSKINEGYRTFKLKVGRHSVEEEAAFLFRLVEHFHEANFKLRLDANRMWDMSQLNEFIKAIKPIANYVDYFEEPLNEKYKSDVLESWASQTGFNYALDEQLLETPFNDIGDLLSRRFYCSHLIIKPMLHGFVRSYQLIKMAQMMEKKPVISSSFESPIGLDHLELLAKWAPESIHGLDTRDFFNL